MMVLPHIKEELKKMTKKEIQYQIAINLHVIAQELIILNNNLKNKRETTWVNGLIT